MKRRSFESEDLNAFHNAMREHVIATDDQELLQELKEDGVDTKARAEEVRAALLAGVKDYHALKRKQLSKKREELGTPATRASWAGKPVAELRRVLENLSKKLSQEQLTLCFRERPQGELTDHEVKAALHKLQMLGVFDESSFE